MSKRGRRSIASKILETLEGVSTEKALYLVIYDFKAKPSLYFYKNLEVIFKVTQDGERIQMSVLQCRMLKTARAIEQLATHYKAQALVFKVEPME